MKKIVLVLLVLVAIGGVVSAWEPLQYPPPLSGGDILIDAGVGLSMGYGSGKMKIPPIFADFEFCLPTAAPISVGAGVSFFRYGYDYSYAVLSKTYSETWTFISVLGRANWHWNINVSWLDLYTGVSLGYLIFNYDVDPEPYAGYPEPSYGGFDFGGQLGAHFYFTQNVGAVIECGYPYLVKAGVALKF